MILATSFSEQFSLLFNSDSQEVAEYISIFWIAMVALLSPIMSSVLKKKVPDVVFQLFFGVLIGPYVFNLATAEHGVALLKELGLGVLFLLAGYEINPGTLKSKQGKSAMLTWLGSFALGLVVAGLVTGFSRGFEVMVAIALTLSSTALGTLLPLLKNQGKSGTKVGDAVMVHGAIGELFPVFAMSLLLSSHSTFISLVVLLFFMLIAIVAAIVPHSLFENIPGLRRVMVAEASTTSQTMLRLAMFLLTTLMMAAAVFELDIVLGAFAAGFILRSLTPDGGVQPFTRRLEAMGFSFLIPLFFICSGMAINVSVIWKQPLLLIAIVFGILLIRGLPVFLVEKFTDTDTGIKTTNEQVQVGLYSAAGLPIIVAVTEVALSHELISEEMASLLVMGGALTVLLFPIWAKAIDTVFDAHSEDKDPSPNEKSSKEKIKDKKSERSKSSKTITSSMPIVSNNQKKNLPPHGSERV